MPSDGTFSYTKDAAWVRQQALCWYGTDAIFLEFTPQSGGQIFFSTAINYRGKHYRWMFLDGARQIVFVLLEFLFAFTSPPGASTWQVVGIAPRQPSSGSISFSAVRATSSAGVLNFFTRYADVEEIVMPHSGIP